MEFPGSHDALIASAPSPMRIRGRGFRRSLIPISRGALIALGLAMSWYVATMFRTSGWGYDRVIESLGGGLFAFVCFGLPWLALASVGRPWRRQLGWLALAMLAVVGASEAFGRLQEYRLMQRLGPTPQGRQIEERWWPFRHHSLGFVEGRWWGCD